jgi:hypothetical protein
MILFDEKIHSYNGGKITLDIKFTTEVWGGFNIGDGEYFIKYVELFKGFEPDFYIQTLFVDNKYKVYFVPSETSYKKAINNLDEKSDEYEMFVNVSEVTTTKDEIIKFIRTNQKFGIYNINFENNKIVIDDMIWYYIGVYCGGTEVLTKLHESDKFKEIKILREKYN